MSMSEQEVASILRGLVDMESGVGMHDEVHVLKPHQRIAIKEAVRLLAEVERLRAEAILLRAQAESAASLLLDVQRDCVEAKQQNAALRLIAERVVVGERVSFGSVEGTVCEWCRLTWRSVDMKTTLPPHTPDCPVTRARPYFASPESPTSLSE